MKKLLSLNILLGLLIILTAFIGGGKGKKDSSVNDTCNRTESASKCKVDLPPFRYNATKTTHITSKPYDQIMEVVMPLYQDTEYRFIFNLEGLDSEIKVEVCDKTLRDDSRKLLYESSSKHFKYEPDGTLGLTRVFVNYVIPPVDSKEEGVINKGCVVLMTGFKNV